MYRLLPLGSLTWTSVDFSVSMFTMVSTGFASPDLSALW